VTSPLELVDRWVGEGSELALRLVDFVDMLRQERLDSGTKSDVADDIESILKGEWNPREQPR
jgi:hypothetical protein